MHNFVPFIVTLVSIELFSSVLLVHGLRSIIVPKHSGQVPHSSMNLRLKSRLLSTKNERRCPTGTGTNIGKQIDAIFAASNKRNKSSTGMAIKEFLSSNSASINHVHVCLLLQRAAKARFDITTIIPLAEITFTLSKSRSVSTGTGVKKFKENFFSALDIAHILYGMRMIDPDKDQEGAKQLLKFITKQVRQLYRMGKDVCVDCIEERSFDNVGSSNMTPVKTDFKYSSRVLKVFFSGQEMSNSLFGLQRFSNAHDKGNTIASAVDDLLEVLHKHFRASLEQTDWHRQKFPKKSFDNHYVANGSFIMDGQEISNALYGMRKMTSASKATRKMMLMLAKYCIPFAPAQSFTAHRVSNALNGLQRMSSKRAHTPVTNDLKKSEAAVTLAVVAALTERINAAVGSIENLSFTMGSWGGAMMGLRSMSNKDSPVVEDLLCALEPLIIGCVKNVPVHSLNKTESISSVDAGFDEFSLSCVLGGFRGMSDDSLVVRRILAIIAFSIENCRSEVISPATAAYMLSGLRSMEGNSKQLRSVIAAIACKLQLPEKEVKNVNHHFSPVDVGIACHGLSSIRSTPDAIPEARVLMSVLADRINYSSERLKNLPSLNQGKYFGMALYGMKNLAAEDSPEANKLLNALANCCSDSESNSKMSAQAMSMAVRGLTGCSSGSNIKKRESFEEIDSDDYIVQSEAVGDSNSNTIICQLLSLLTPRLGSLDPQACGNILFAMQRMSCDQSEVRDFLGALAPRIKEIKETLSAQELTSALYGLQGMDSRYPETTAVLAALNTKIRQHSQLHHLKQSFSSRNISDESAPVAKDPFTFSALECGRALTGLQSMGITCAAELSSMVASGKNEDLRYDADATVEDTLLLLADKIEECKDAFTPGDIANALFGLQGMEEATEGIRAVLDVLTQKMKQQNFDERIKNTRYSVRDIGYCLSGIHALLPQRFVHSEVEEILEELNLKVAQSKLGGAAELRIIQRGRGVKVEVPNVAASL